MRKFVKYYLVYSDERNWFNINKVSYSILFTLVTIPLMYFKSVKIKKENSEIYKSEFSHSIN